MAEEETKGMIKERKTMVSRITMFFYRVRAADRFKLGSRRKKAAVA